MIAAMHTWKPITAYRPAFVGLSRQLFDWLRVGGSLSAHLRRSLGGLEVQRCFQGKTWRQADDGAFFGRITHVEGPRCPRQRLFARDVVLRCQGAPVVMAHSIAPIASLRGSWRGLLGLGSRPLAELLFSDRRVKRLPMQIAKLSTRSPLGRKWAAQWKERTGLSAWQAPERTHLWARRSAFVRHGQRLWVTEIFDPSMAATALIGARTHGKPRANRASASPTQR
jgi:chorismate--pyruvate lyase